MDDLTRKKCVPCEVGTPPLSEKEQLEYHKQTPAWRLIDGRTIERSLRFRDFGEALSFVNRVGGLAEEEGHHPDISLHNYNRVTVSLTTHNIKGLSPNDFIMAAKIDRLEPQHPNE